MLLPKTKLIRFYNPRKDKWDKHFVFDGVQIKAKTEIGEVTIKILELNTTERLLERLELQSIGRYPIRIS